MTETRYLFIRIIRQLHEPADIGLCNREYTRGQMELVLDTLGYAPQDHDDAMDTLYREIYSGWGTSGATEWAATR